MAKTRIVDINEIAYGKEPEPAISLSHKLNWYSAASNLDDKKKWAIEYFKKDVGICKKLNSIDKQWFATLGSICRILSRGGTLGLFERQSFDAMFSRIISEQYKKPKHREIKKVNILEIDKKMEPLNMMYEQIDEIVDTVIHGAKKYELPILSDGLLNTWIVEATKYYHIQLSEIELVYLGTDEQLNESYSVYTKADIKRLMRLYKDIETLLNQYLVRQRNLKSQSKPTKSKPTSKLVEKLNFLKSDKATNLTSIDPTKIVGCKRLYVYNVKTRKLAEYSSIDGSGLSVKGSTLIGFSDKSFSKTVRKPLDFFMGFMGVTIFKQSKQISMIKSVEGKVTGRINKDCILLNCK